MGVRNNPAHESKTTKLARLARPLKPDRPPFYVQHADPSTPLVGWWWQPAGAERPAPLGMSYEAALIVLANTLTTELEAA